MMHRYLSIGRWDVDFYFATEGYKAEILLPVLDEFGIDGSFLARVEEIIDANLPDTGFICIDRKMKEAIIVIGPTTSGAEFIDTMVHEIHHLAVAIADSLGVDLQGETPAYLSGDSARELAEVLCKLGCSHCKE